MQGVKAIIQGNNVNSSVEFSVEEVIAQYKGKPWAELSEAEQDSAMRDYALSLFSRQSGISDNFRVSLEEGTFSKVNEKDI
jgi:hypothetical protein